MGEPFPLKKDEVLTVVKQEPGFEPEVEAVAVDSALGKKELARKTMLPDND